MDWRNILGHAHLKDTCLRCKRKKFGSNLKLGFIMVENVEKKQITIPAYLNQVLALQLDVKMPLLCFLSNQGISLVIRYFENVCYA